MTIVAAPRAIIYARRSIRQKNAASVTDQVAGGEGACAGNGWDVAAVIDQDDDRSASRFARKERPGWDQLLASLRAGMADVVVLWESSRGDRKLSEWAAFLDLCRERNVLIHVVSHDRAYDLSKSRDWRTLADEGVNSAMESETISGRVRRGKASAARRGEPYPVPPYGYRAVYHQFTGKREGWVIVPERAAIVREIFARVSDHESLKAIRRDLNERGVPAARGGPWTEQQVRHVAMNLAYASLLRLDDGELIDGTWPPIVTKAQWNACMAVLRPRLTGKRPGGQKHLLTYLANCECGSPLVARIVSGTPRYSCRKGCFYIPEEWLDDLVADGICERLSYPDARDLFKSDDTRSAALVNEIAELQAQLDEWAAADISARAYGVKEAQLLPKIERAQRELDALTIPPALAGILKAENVRASWGTYTIQAKRAIITAMTGVEVRKARPGEPRLSPHRVTFTGEPARRRGK
jgi:site-specific DNA recombinase